MTARPFWFVTLVAGSVAACRGAAPLPPAAIELNQGGIAALQAGDLDTADRRFALALEYSPRFVEALSNQGLVQLQLGNFNRARQLLERARRLNPDVAQPHHALGLLAERRHRPDLATEHYRAALAVDPGFVPARTNLARLLFAAGHVEHAREQFALAVATSPSDLTGLVGLVECLLRLHRNAEADAALHRAQEAHPGAPAVILLVARQALRRGQLAAAKALLAPLASGGDDDAVAALAWLGVAELLDDRPRYAVGAGRRALRLSPDDPLATWVVATALESLEDHRAATWKARAAALVGR
jgi:Tfp pilus assembly protein PilF